MPRGWLTLLAVFLLVWVPLQFSAELTATLGTISMRGPWAVLELAAHAGVAALSFAAGWALWVGNRPGPTFAMMALPAYAAYSVQSLYWSVLPGQTMPGDKLPKAIIAVVHAMVWMVYLRRSRRVRAMAEQQSSGPRLSR
jgi:hypothetical protein